MHAEPLTRGSLLRRTCIAVAPVVLGSSSLALAASPRTLVVTPAQLVEARRNIFVRKQPYSRRAWQNTLGSANALLSYQPAPTRRDADVSDWRSVIYLPGLHDGNAALTLACAHAVGQRSSHAERARAICLAWARTYNPPPPNHLIGHMVAESVGPVIKLCMAYDLVKHTMSVGERTEFVGWAAQFVERAKKNVDFTRDEPWEPDLNYGGDRTNVVPYGNSATWQRAMAVWAAAAVGGSTLRNTLEWNFRHSTAKGHDYGWDNLLEGLVIDRTGGQLTEDRWRSSIEYGHFSWIPAVLIADVARNAGFRVDLFDYRTKQNGYSIFTPATYYSRYLMRSSVPSELERTQYGGTSWPKTASRWRAAYEVLYRNAKAPSDLKALAKVVSWGGAGQRGDNFDVYILGFAALFGRGPKGPRPRG